MWDICSAQKIDESQLQQPKQRKADGWFDDIFNCCELTNNRFELEQKEQQHGTREGLEPAKPKKIQKKSHSKAQPPLQRVSSGNSGLSKDFWSMEVPNLNEDESNQGFYGNMQEGNPRTSHLQKVASGRTNPTSKTKEQGRGHDDPDMILRPTRAPAGRSTQKARESAGHDDPDMISRPARAPEGRINSLWAGREAGRRRKDDYCWHSQAQELKQSLKTLRQEMDVCPQTGKFVEKKPAAQGSFLADFERRRSEVCTSSTQQALKERVEKWVAQSSQRTRSSNSEHNVMLVKTGSKQRFGVTEEWVRGKAVPGWGAKSHKA